ncbi:MAG TPA: lysophospholipase [Candidatus Atribacteria bacterium]|nr:lysophospholipase [Candidatus Atribacteria bacterium]
MKHSEFKFKTFDGLSLFGQNWQPENHPKAVICLVHGLGEHSGRYVPIANSLTQVGYVLVSFDLRGHGKSSGPRGHTPSYEALIQDISSLLEVSNKKFSKLPFFLYGHSLGGNLVLNYVLRRKPYLKGVITTAPWLRLAFEPPIFKIILGKITNYTWPSFSQKSGLDTKALSRDPKVVYTYENDPLVHDRISARMFISTFQAGQWVLEHASEFSLPLLLMLGGADKIISVKASKEFADKISEKCTFKIWDGLYHEIHNEPEKEEVFKFLIDWLDKEI